MRKLSRNSVFNIFRRKLHHEHTNIVVHFRARSTQSHIKSTWFMTKKTYWRANISYVIIATLLQYLHFSVVAFDGFSLPLTFYMREFRLLFTSLFVILDGQIRDQIMVKFENERNSHNFSLSYRSKLLFFSQISPSMKGQTINTNFNYKTFANYIIVN